MNSQVNNTTPTLTPNQAPNRIPTGWYVMSVFGFLVGIALYTLLFVLILTGTDQGTINIVKFASILLLLGSPTAGVALLARDAMLRRHNRKGNRADARAAATRAKNKARTK